MGEEFQGEWMRKLPYVLLGRRTAFHADLKATPATVVMGEDPQLPGELTPPMGAGETMTDLLQRVKLLPHRPPAQTNHRKQAKVYMPPSTESATHVYTKNPKKTPLGPSNHGPYKIVDKLGKSCLKIHTGDFANGTKRTEIRHWNTCYPTTLDSDQPSAVKKPLGRKPLNVKAKPFKPTT